MILLTNTNQLTPSSSKSKKAKLYRLPLERISKPLTPTQLKPYLLKAHTVYCCSLPKKPNMLKALSKNADTNDYYKVADFTPYSHYKMLDFEARLQDIHHLLQAQQLPKQEQLDYLAYHYPYEDPSRLIDLIPALTEQKIHERIAKLAPNGYLWQYSDSHSHSDLRLHAMLCFSRAEHNDRVADYIDSVFPEHIVANDRNTVKRYALDSSPTPPRNSVKPLYIDQVTYRPKQKMYMSPHPLHVVVTTDIEKPIHNTRFKKQGKQVFNLIRRDLVEAYQVQAAKEHGTLEEAQHYYYVNGDTVPKDTIIYDMSRRPLGTIVEVQDNPALYGKNCNFHPDYHPKTGYLQVGASGGYITDHTTQTRVQVEVDTIDVTDLEGVSKYVDYIDLKQKREALIAPTGSGKTTIQQNRPHTILLVPTNKQVLAETEGFARVISKDLYPLYAHEKNLYESIADAEAANHTTMIMTYDKFAGYYMGKSSREHMAQYNVVADEIHEFLTMVSSGGGHNYNYSRDTLFRAFQNPEEFKSVLFMSATISPSFLNDIVPNQPIHTPQILQTRPQTVITNQYGWHELSAEIDSSKRVVVYVNNVAMCKGIVQKKPLKKSAYITGSSTESPKAILDTKPELLTMTSTVKQGFSITYEVDTYVVFLDVMNLVDYSLDEINQITARCRDAKQLIIVVADRRQHHRQKDIVPSQAECIEAAIELAGDNPSKELWDRDNLSGYYRLIANIGQATEDEAAPLFYLSERILLGNRMKMDSIHRAYGLKDKKNLIINGEIAPIVCDWGSCYPPNLPLGGLTPLVADLMTLQDMCHSLDEDDTEGIDNLGRAIDAFIVTYGSNEDNPLEQLHHLDKAEQKLYDYVVGVKHKLGYRPRIKPLTQYYMMVGSKGFVTEEYKGWCNRVKIRDSKKALLGDKCVVTKKVSTLNRIWKAKESVVKKLKLNPRTLTVISTIDILESKLHQRLELVGINSKGLTETLQPVISDGTEEQTRQYSYDNTYPNKRGQTIIGWTDSEGTIYRCKREPARKKGEYTRGYPVGATIHIYNKEYIYED